MASTDTVSADRSALDLRSPMRRALENIRARTSVSLAFGGPVNRNGSVRLENFAGQTLGALPGVELTHGEGLGGKAAALQRGITVNDYFVASSITHRYDSIIRAEGLTSLIAVPVIVRRNVVGVIYGAFRNSDIIGGRIQRAVEEEARALEQSLVVRDVITPRETTDALESTRLREQLRETHRTLKELAGRATDPSVREALSALAERLLATQTGFAAQTASAEMPTPLTAREKDVLELAGAGLPNQAIADVLGLAIYTVKGYMKSSMAKLGARSRLEAVVSARSMGIIA